MSGMGAKLATLIGAAAVTGALAAGSIASGQSAGSYQFTTAMSQINAGSNNSGWWSPTRKNANSNDNYFVGGSSGLLFRDYFSFDISGLRNPCRPQSAVLTIPTGPNESSGYPYLTLGLFDVSTDPYTLANKNNSPNASIYNDLGSGTQFGSYLLPTSSGPSGSTFTLQLNSSFLHAFTVAKQAHQQWLSIGGSVINVPPGDANFFGFTNEHEVVVLTVAIPKVCKIS
jgi:hypothetical protein